MDRGFREAQRRHLAGDPGAFRDCLRQLARAGRRRELIRLVIDTPQGFVLCGAVNLGHLKGTQDCGVQSGSAPLEPEDFAAELIAWELPPDLAGGVLLESRRGRSTRQVSLVPQGRDLDLDVETRRMEEINEVELEVSLLIAESRTLLAQLVAEGEELPSSWDALFQRVAGAVGGELHYRRSVTYLD